MKRKFSLGLVWDSLKDSFKGFSDNKVTKLSASLAYYTTFSVGPLLIVVIYLCSLFFGREAIEGTIYTQVKSFIGPDAATQVQTMIRNAAVANKNGIAAVIGIITLLIGATTVFGDIQDSINSIWGVKAKPKAGIMKMLKTRLLSFGIIATLGFLLLVSLIVTTVVESIGNRLEESFPDVAVIVIYAVNLLLTIAVTTALFAIIFKVLPDVKIKTKAIWPGAITTSVLFLAGKFLISLYISKANVGSTYGAAGSLVILILWVYFSSMILYFGAEFTKWYALQRGVQIIPTEMAEWNDKPAVAGAKSPSQVGKEHPLQSKLNNDMNEHIHKRDQQEQHKEQKPKKSKSGFGMVAAGLLLYFLKSARETDGSRQS
jgi:membrane protein